MKTKGSPRKGKTLHLTLYIADETIRSNNALANLKRIAKEHPEDKCDIEIIDILKPPGAAKRDQIVAIPTLVWETATFTKRLLGDLSNTSKVLGALGFSAVR